MHCRIPSQEHRIARENGQMSQRRQVLATRAGGQFGRYPIRNACRRCRGANSPPDIFGSVGGTRQQHRRQSGSAECCRDRGNKLRPDPTSKAEQRGEEGRVKQCHGAQVPAADSPFRRPVSRSCGAGVSRLFLSRHAGGVTNGMRACRNALAGLTLCNKTAALRLVFLQFFSGRLQPQRGVRGNMLIGLKLFLRNMRNLVLVLGVPAALVFVYATFIQKAVPRSRCLCATERRGTVAGASQGAGDAAGISGSPASPAGRRDHVRHQVQA